MSNLDNKTEVNPFRIMASIFDIVSYRLRLLNFSINRITLDFWVVVISLIAMIIPIANNNYDEPLPQMLLLFGALFIPYDLYRIMIIFKNPMPFFKREGNWVIRNGNHFSVWCFGWFNQQHEGKIKKINYRWSKGTVKMIDGEVLLNVRVKAFTFWGVISNEFNYKIDRTKFETGTATNHFKRAHAMKLQSENMSLTVVIREEA